MFSDENNFNILKCILVFLYDCYICIYIYENKEYFGKKNFMFYLE